jgi:uncharacterized FAD-dependent dehydrogenase
MRNMANTLIVGSGPAGIFAAHELANCVDSEEILILEKGLDLARRHCPDSQRHSGICERCDIMHGWGGPGFYIDAKLCLDSNVGTKLGTDTFNSETELIKYVDQIIEDYLSLANIQTHINYIMAERADEEIRRFAAANLELTLYPVRSLGSDIGRIFARTIKSKLDTAGVKVGFGNEVIDIVPKGKFIEVYSQSVKGTIKKFMANNVILAPGRSGARAMQRWCRKFGIKLTQNPLDIGVRLEFPREVGDNFGKLGSNPKIKRWKSEDSYVKTHCFCPGGYVLSYQIVYPDDIVRIVDGHSYSSHDSINSNINIFFRQKYPEHCDAVQIGSSIVRNVNHIGRGYPLLQLLGDLRIGKATTWSSLDKNYVQPTLPIFSLQDINLVYPRGIINSILEFLDTLEQLVPGINSDETLVYAPAVEWCVKRVATNNSMQTNVDGLYVAGDGAGLTQGVVAAAVTGILAAKSIIGD